MYLCIGIGIHVQKIGNENVTKVPPGEMKECGNGRCSSSVWTGSNETGENVEASPTSHGMEYKYDFKTKSRTSRWWER